MATVMVVVAIITVVMMIGSTYYRVVIVISVVYWLARFDTSQRVKVRTHPAVVFPFYLGRIRNGYLGQPEEDIL